MNDIQYTALKQYLESSGDTLENILADCENWRAARHRSPILTGQDQESVENIKALRKTLKQAASHPLA
jgi:hypothetical protein